MNPAPYAQRRPWLLHQLGAPAAAVHVAVALRLSGSLDKAALALALGDAVARHEVLSSVFHEGGPSELHRQVQREFSLDLPVTDVAQADLDTVLAGIVERPFHLASEIPVRAALLRCAPDDHTLVLVVHRIAADETSLAVLVDELLRAYASRAHGEPPRWEHRPAQYADFVARQSGVLGSPSDPNSALAMLRLSWQAELTGLPSPLPLPTDRPRPPVASLRGDTVVFVLEPDLADATAWLASQHATTTASVLRAALGVLLHQLGGGADLPIGTLVDGRTHTTYIGSVGPFTGIALDRLNLSGNPPFTAVLEQICAARDRPAVPFEYLLEALRPERSLAYHPLCQVAFAWRPAGPPARELPGLTVASRRVPTGTTSFDLTFTFDEPAARAHHAINGEIEYAVDLFAPDTVGAIAERYAHILRQVTADARTRVGAFDALLPAERESVILVNRAAPPAVYVTVPEMVRPRVEATPDAVAVAYRDQTLTYRQLWWRARRLATALRRAGVGVESLVGLALPRTADLVVALLGVMMSGGAYVPIDPRYPSQRLGFLLEDADPVLVLTDTTTRAELPTHTIPLCLMDTMDLDPPAGDDGTWTSEVDDGGPTVHPENLAYVMYTSGSTGIPKGVGITHAAVVNGVTDLARVVGMRPGSRMLGSTSVNFDVSVFEVFTALSTGATVEIVRDILEIGERGGWSGSVLHTVPSVFADVVACVGQNLRVDTAVFAGEALPATLVQQVRKAVPGALVVNAYGQTESFYATTFTVPPGWDGTNVPIGGPLGGMRAYVLNAVLSPAPPGVVGELYIGGIVARGYHRQGGLTAQRFLPDPFGPPGSRMYRTGDLARVNAAGQLELVGRTDTQLKVRGVRIEPAEIEKVLVSHPDIAQAVTALLPVGREGKRLVAYLVPATTGTDLDPRKLRRYVADRLPAFMIPAAFVILDRLPLTANGKLDQARLPEPGPARRSGPRSAREQQLVGLFAEVLGRDTVEVDDDFFTIGGDSLQAVHLVRRAHTELGVELPVEAIFHAPTVTALDDYLTSHLA